MNPCATCLLDMNSSTVPGTKVGPDKNWYCEVHWITAMLGHEPVDKSLSPSDPSLGPFAWQGSGSTIKQHSGNKYVRRTTPPAGCAPGEVDVYAVLEAFGVTCPATQHALKKLLCAGLRGKGDRVKDLTEAVDALRRAIEMQRAREAAAARAE